MNKQSKITFVMVFSVGAVLFSSHAGGGFATGNQANTYYVGLGWLGPIAAILSMTISLAGLTNIIKYGYGYCGYLGIAIVVIPFLTVGVYKNRKYMREHGEDFTPTDKD